MKIFHILFCLLSIMLLSCQPSTDQKKRVKTANTYLPVVHVSDSKKMAGANTAPGQVKIYLQTKYKNDLQKGFIDTLSRKFFVVEFDLNNDGKKELFVGLTGPYFCGSGGCNALLLGDGKLITQFTVTNYPVFIANTSTNGWHDLVIYSNAQYRLVKFNGNKYPSNPSLAPVIRIKQGDYLLKFEQPDSSSGSWYQF